MKGLIKETIKKVLPESIFYFLKKLKYKRGLSKEYKYDFNRYLKYADSFLSFSEQTSLGSIIRNYHVVEKGLTMPEPRLGFGKELLLRLINECLIYITHYGDSNEQLKHAVHVIAEYEQFHHNRNFQLDDIVIEKINALRAIVTDFSPSNQRKISKETFFSEKNSSFPEFARSRSSVRNYALEDLPVERVLDAIELARTTPSACNRQCWRTYIFEEKELISKILLEQGGNRGFGHLANKLIVITAEVGVFTGPRERNEVYIDGGMYAMNLLYCMHYYEIVGCILNCSNDIQKDLRLRNLCKIKDSEVFIAMISCGLPADKFSVAISPRYTLGNTNQIIK